MPDPCSPAALLRQGASTGLRIFTARGSELLGIEKLGGIDVNLVKCLLPEFPLLKADFQAVFGRFFAFFASPD